MSENKNPLASCEIFLIRHAEVDSAWKGICYGSLDVALSQQGVNDSKKFAEQIGATLRGEDAKKLTTIRHIIFHSGLSRTLLLAQALAEAMGDVELFDDDRLKERDYGLWQGQGWDAAYQSDPEHFHDLVDQPDTYRPPEGETTTEMQRRIVSWYEDVSARLAGCRILAVSHSGPIAALAGHLLNLPANQWAPWIIGNLDWIVINHAMVQRMDRDRFF